MFGCVCVCVCVLILRHATSPASPASPVESRVAQKSQQRGGSEVDLHVAQSELAVYEMSWVSDCGRRQGVCIILSRWDDL